MTLLRAVVAILLPPLAVFDKGIGNFLVVLLLWIFGFIVGGQIAAVYIISNDRDLRW